MGKGERAGLGLSSLNNVGGLWSKGAVPSCLVPDPWVIKAGG